MASTAPRREDSFERTLKEFKKQLTLEQQHEFGATTLKDLQVTIVALQKKQISTRTAQNLRRIQGFLEGMEANAKVIEVFLNVHNFVAFIWGPIKFLLQAASTFAEAFNALLDAYQRIGENMPLFAEYQALFDSDPTMRQILELYYQDIFEFHQRAIKFFKCSVWQHMFHATWKQFDSKFGYILKNMLEHKRLVEKKASLIEFSEAKEARTLAVKEFAEANEARKLAEREFQRLDTQESHWRKTHVGNWLAAANVEADQERGQNVRKDRAQAGRWLLSKQKFRAWSPSAPLLWIHGAPGSGKSVLASLVAEELAKLTPKRVLYFYCRYDDPRKQTFVAMACSLLQQLLHLDDLILNQLYETAVSDGGQHLTSRKTAESTLEICLKAVGSVTIILDGIDECPDFDEQKVMVQWLLKYVTSSSAEPDPSRCLILSQHDEKTKSLLGEIPTIKLDVADNKKDIEIYCQDRVREFPDLLEISDEERARIAGIVSERAQGMFLFAKVVMDNLAEQTSPSDLRTELQPDILPHKLEEAYKRITIRVFDQAHPTRRLHGLRLLSWIVCSVRPLQWREALAASAIDLDNDSVDFVNKAWKLDHTGLCGPFVEKESDGTIRLVHATAKNYLIHTGDVVPRVDHVKLATLCLSYLCLPVFGKPDENTDHKSDILNGMFTFLNYALISWPSHLLAAAHHQQDLQSQNNLEYLETTTQMMETLETFLELHWHAPEKQSKVSRNIVDCVQALRRPALYDKLLSTMVSIRNFTSYEVPSMRAFATLDLFEILYSVRLQLETLAADGSHSSVIEKYYGHKAYMCPRLYCEWFSEGFAKFDDREEHLRKHERSHFCPYSTCSYARIGCATARELETHITNYHQPAPKETEFEPEEKRVKVGNGQLQCPDCPKTFTRMSNLRAHRRTHTDERPFECSICNKKFARQHDCKVHEQQHAKQKQAITCRGALDSGFSWGCGKKFYGANALARHFGNQTGRNCIKPLLDQESAKQQATSSQRQSQLFDGRIPRLHEVKQLEVDSEHLPPILLEQIPELATIDSGDLTSQTDYLDTPEESGSIGHSQDHETYAKDTH